LREFEELRLLRKICCEDSTADKINWRDSREKRGGGGSIRGLPFLFFAIIASNCLRKRKERLCYFLKITRLEHESLSGAVKRGC
jgi:hypothetical protein